MKEVMDDGLRRLKCYSEDVTAMKPAGHDFCTFGLTTVQAFLGDLHGIMRHVTI